MRSSRFCVWLTICAVSVAGDGWMRWVFGEESEDAPWARVDEHRDSSSTALDFTKITAPFEIQREDPFLNEVEKYTGLKMSELDRCQHQIIYDLKTTCTRMSEEEIAKMGVQLLNCQSRVEGRKEYPCYEEMTLRDCTQKMDDNAWNAYHLMSNRARAVCYAARQQQFAVKTELTVNRLVQSTEEHVEGLKSIKEGQLELGRLTSDTLEEVSRGHEALAVKQNQLKDAQLSIQGFVSENLRELSKEKMLIAAVQAELGLMKDSIKSHLDEAAEYLVNFESSRRVGHEEILRDLNEVHMKTRDAWDRVDGLTDRILRIHTETLESLSTIRSSIGSLHRVLEDVDFRVNKKLHWLNSTLSVFQMDEAGRLEDLFVVVSHVAYLLATVWFACFLKFPMLSRIFMILIIPLNAAAALSNKELALEFPSLTALIIIMLGSELFVSYKSQSFVRIGKGVGGWLSSETCPAVTPVATVVPAARFSRIAGGEDNLISEDEDLGCDRNDSGVMSPRRPPVEEAGRSALRRNVNFPAFPTFCSTPRADVNVQWDNPPPLSRVSMMNQVIQNSGGHPCIPQTLDVRAAKRSLLDRLLQDQSEMQNVEDDVEEENRENSEQRNMRSQTPLSVTSSTRTGRMDALLEWLNTFDALAEDVKNPLKEKVAVAKAESDNVLFALERSSRASGEKCKEQAATIEQLEDRARTAEARAAAAELREENLKARTEQLSEEVKVFEQRIQLRLAEQEDLAGFLESKSQEVNRLREELKAMNDSLRDSQQARLTAQIEAEMANAREEGLKAEISRLRARVEAGADQFAEYQIEMRKQHDELYENLREQKNHALRLEMNLENKIEELKIAQNTVEDYKSSVDDQREKVRDLLDQLHKIQENTIVLETNYKSQLDAQRQLVALHEENARSADIRAQALEERGKQLDESFARASEEHYAEVEALVNSCQEIKSVVAEREETIEAMRRDLEHAHKLIEKFEKHGVSDESLSKLSPAAAAATKFVKSGLTLTGMYSQYVAASEEAQRLLTENEELKLKLEHLANEIRARAPAWKQERERADETRIIVKTLTGKLSDASKECQALRFQLIDAKSVSEKLRHDAEVRNATMKDLRSQITTLTVELEKLRGNKRGILTPENDANNLVTFKSVEELQVKNEQLLTKLRAVETELETYKRETDEKINAEMKAKAEKELTDLREGRERSSKILENLRLQRDMYKGISDRCSCDGNAGIRVPPGMGSTPSTPLNQSRSRLSNTSIHASPRISVNADERRDFEDRLKTTNEGFETFKKEHELLKVELSTNAKLLMEENSQLKEKVDKLRHESIKSRMEMESSVERLNVAKTNMDMYKKQLNGAEEMSKRMNLTMAKLEHTLEEVREELSSTRKKLNESERKVQSMNQDLFKSQSEIDRLNKTNSLLEEAIHNQAGVITDLRAFRVELESRESSEQLALKNTITNIKKDLAAAERRAAEAAVSAQEEANALREAAAKANGEARKKQDCIVKLEEEIAKLNSQVEEMRSGRLDVPIGSRLNSALEESQSATDVSNNLATLNLRLREAEAELQESRLRVLALQRESEASQAHAAEYKRMAAGLEDALQSANNALKAQQADTATRVTGFEERVRELEEARATVESENESLKEARKLLNEQLESCEISRKSQLEHADKDRVAAESRAANAEAALAIATKDLIELRNSCAELSTRFAHESSRRQELEASIGETRRELDATRVKASDSEKDLESTRNFLSSVEEQLQELKQKFEDAKLARDSETEEKPGSDGTPDSAASVGAGAESKSGAGDEADDSATPEQLKKLIDYLKKEKELKSAKLRTQSLENTRLQQTVANLKAEMKALQSALAAARVSAGLSSEVGPSGSPRSSGGLKMISVTEHEEVLRKVQLAAAVEDSNRMLRDERDSLTSKLKETEARVVDLEVERGPKNLKIQELDTKLGHLNAECETLRIEAKRWQERANSMIERTQKVNPQDLERLVSERDKLFQAVQEKDKQIQERDKVLAEKDRFLVEKEKEAVERDVLSKDREKIGAERDRILDLNKKLTEEIENLRSSANEAETQANDLRGQLAQVRRVARKYKETSESLRKDVDKLNNELKQAKEALQKIEEAKESEVKVDPAAEAKFNEALENISRLEGLIKEKDNQQTKARETLELARSRLKLVTEQKNVLQKALQNSNVPAPSLPSVPSISDADCAALLGLNPEPWLAQLAELRSEKEALLKEIDLLKMKISAAAASLPAPNSGSGASGSSTLRSCIEVQPQMQQPQASMVASISRMTPTASIRPLRSESGPTPTTNTPTSMPITGVVLPTIAVAENSASSSSDQPEETEVHPLPPLSAVTSSSSSVGNVAMISPNLSRGPVASDPGAGPSNVGSSSPKPKTRKRELDTTFAATTTSMGDPSKRTRVEIGPFEMVPVDSDIIPEGESILVEEDAEDSMDAEAGNLEGDEDDGEVLNEEEDEELNQAVTGEVAEVPEESQVDPVPGSSSGMSSSNDSTTGRRCILLPRSAGVSSIRSQQPAAQNVLQTSSFMQSTFEEGDDGIVPSTPTLCPSRGITEAEASSSVPVDVPPSSQFMFSGRAGVTAAASPASAVGGHLDDTRVDLFEGGNVEAQEPEQQSERTTEDPPAQRLMSSSLQHPQAPQQQQQPPPPQQQQQQQQILQQIQQQSADAGRRVISMTPRPFMEHPPPPIHFRSMPPHPAMQQMPIQYRRGIYERGSMRGQRRPMAYGNFPDYYKFNPAENRMNALRSGSDILKKLMEDLKHEEFLVLDIGCNSGELTVEFGVFLASLLPETCRVVILALEKDAHLVEKSKPLLSGNTSEKLSVVVELADVMNFPETESLLKSFLQGRNEERFHLTTCFSVLMWIHLVHDDSGLEKLLNFLGNYSENSLVEIQPWKCYQT
ncbi:unnamed protein product [Notodromas monacha]|uniref:Uncharacterized protein n=1 Tax=Notodromas monacha TaxID=399045 RepID=A0A7R9BK52_9CRUS|nr:unnamed protein product [Notodromas monacha]CAG0916188.1 unnamed protein product [Notodromas monacha]